MDVGGWGEGVDVGIVACVSRIAVSIAFVGLVVGGDVKLLQDASMTATRNNGNIVLLMIFTFPLPIIMDAASN